MLYMGLPLKAVYMLQPVHCVVVCEDLDVSQFAGITRLSLSYTVSQFHFGDRPRRWLSPLKLLTGLAPGYYRTTSPGRYLPVLPAWVG